MEIFFEYVSFKFLRKRNLADDGTGQSDRCTHDACDCGALVAVWYSAGFAIRRLRVRISAWVTSHQGLLSLPSLRGR